MTTRQPDDLPLWIEAPGQFFGAIGQRLVDAERVLSRLALFGMILYGVAAGAERDVSEADRLHAHLAFWLGVVGIAIVSRLPVRR